jgi:hypothetical protein
MITGTGQAGLRPHAEIIEVEPAGVEIAEC